MLQAGLQTELANCLASRKRKLSELFACTVGFNTEIDPKHRQRETQFLDANDLEKNRYFSLSTLPPRPDFTNINVANQSFQNDSQPIERSPAKSEAKRTQTRGIDVVGATQPTVGSTESRRSGKQTTLSGPNAQRPVSESTGEQDDKLKIGGGTKGGRNGEDGVESMDLDPDGTPQSALEVNKIAKIESPPLSPGVDPAQMTKDAKKRPATRPSLSIPSPRKVMEDTVMADVHSSPTSSHDAPSSNQEVAIGSPTTSPGEDAGAAAEGIDSDLAGTASAVDVKGHAAPATPTETSTQQDDRTAKAVQSDSEHPSKKIMAENTAATTPSNHARRTTGTSSTMPSPLERMTTRVSSGALRHKSVSEILGATPKPTSPSGEKSAGDKSSAESSRAASVAVSAGSPSGRNTPDTTQQNRQNDRKDKDKERSRLSTVVFAKQQAADKMESTELLLKVGGENPLLTKEERDYLWTLFESRAYTPPRGLPLGALLQSAHKSLTTTDHLIEYQEQMNCRTLKRIYQLQNANRWPLRQMGRAAEPPRGTSHWDFVLDHVKWMRTDFREERKWKLAAAKGMAEWCAEWVASDSEGRRALQVQVRPPRILPESSADIDISMSDQPIDAEGEQPTPELVASAENDSVSDGFADEIRDLGFANMPAAIFSLGAGDFSFPITKTPAAEKLLNELPLYQPSRVEPDLAQSDLAERMDAQWKKDILPISKFASGKIRFVSKKAPRKRSRYEYESDDTDAEESVPLEPEQKNVGLFLAENKHIRDRIHPGHSFRPPTEHPMPTQAFFEARISSQWTATEDDELRKLVKDYSYNWSLISSCLTPRTLYYSGHERRTPWECFERWIGLEGLPADMSKTPYFRAYHSRIEAAGRRILAQQQAAQEAAANGQTAIVPKKKTTQPMRVERRRATRHLAMIDGMRKLAKKRETALQKQQHAAGLAAMRRVNEAKQPSKPPISTPAEFSRLKHEREVKAAEKAELYRQQVLAHQKAAMQHRNAQAAQPNGVPNAASRANGMPVGASPNGGPANLAALPTGPNGQLLQPNQPRTHPALQGLPTAGSPNGPIPANMMNMKGLPPGQLPPNMVGRGLPNTNSPEGMRILYEANRVQAEQQRFLAQRQQQAQMAQQGMPNQAGPHSSPNMGMASMNGTPNNAAMIAALQAAGGMPSPSVQNAASAGGSPPRPNAAQPLSSGVIPAISQIIGNIQSRNPEMPIEEVQRLATHQLNKFQQQQQMQQRSMNQAALNAAAGAANAGAHAANAGYNINAAGQRQAMMTNEQVQAYNDLMRRQQAAQRANGTPVQMVGSSPIMNGARPQSRSATPRDQRNGGQALPVNAPNGQSKSPSMASSQMNTQG